MSASVVKVIKRKIKCDGEYSAELQRRVAVLYAKGQLSDSEVEEIEDYATSLGYEFDSILSDDEDTAETETEE